MPDGTVHYDVFISHSSADKAWVTALACNLKRHGHSVWLDAWELVPGRNFIQGLQDGLDRSQAAILIVTREAQASGWVQDEYSTMLRRRNCEPGFVVIPVLLDVDGDFPFLRNVHCVDFREPTRYRQAFYELLCGLKGAAPEPDRLFDGALDIPEERRVLTVQPRAANFLDEIFEDLESDHLSVILAQEGMGTGPIAQELLARARSRFAPKNVFHIVPPCTGNDNLDDYFAEVAYQCGVSNGQGAEASLRRHVFDQLDSGDRLLVLLSDFENGGDLARRRLASLLRGLYDCFPDRMRVMFRGGEKLAALKYDQGQISILSIAATYHWPEYTPSDVQELYRQRYRGETITSDDADTILATTGGEPRLVNHCLKLRYRFATLTANGYRDELRASDVAWQLFTPLAHTPSLVERIRPCLLQTDLGPAPAFLTDPGLRWLYWRNLVARRIIEGRPRLCWRCELLRDTGRDVLQCA
jgi:hypothetical protein